MPRDLLFPSAAEEKQMHKLKRLVQSPNSFFMDVKCPGCFNITTVFSHAQTLAYLSKQCWSSGSASDAIAAAAQSAAVGVQCSSSSAERSTAKSSGSNSSCTRADSSPSSR
eukprot:9136-Heterococcus_DN1.PRE.2